MFRKILANTLVLQYWINSESLVPLSENLKITRQNSFFELI
jgi:hypothetical protein